MKKRFLAVIAIVAILAVQATGTAKDFVKIQESPLYSWYELTPLDMNDNPLFDIVGEMTTEEGEQILGSDVDDYDVYPSMRLGVYNDGLTCLLSILQDAAGENVVPYLVDINGNRIFHPGRMARPMIAGNEPYAYSYNLGYVYEQIGRTDPSGTAYTNTNFINLMTGESYYFERISVGKFYNDGSMILVYNSGEKYYKAQLKKPAIVTVHLDGKKIYFDQIPVVENGRTLVPLRAIFEKLGATVDWNSETQTVTATKDDTTITLTIDNTRATKNGEEITLDVPAKIIGGRTLVPVRFVADCFGVDVVWDDAMQKVLLTQNG